MEQKQNFTEGKILGPLVRFALPVLLALFLQAMYGAVDLLVVGRFSTTAEVSGVATGSGIMQTVTMIVTGLAMGLTVRVASCIGSDDPDGAGRSIGGGICLFAAVAVGMTLLLTLCAQPLARLMQAPEAALSQTANYVRICGAGSIFIIAYNLFGSVFRGIGDSKTPLMTVAIACAVNIAGDLLCVGVFKMGAAGAAVATVAAQAASVVVSAAVIRKRKNAVRFSKNDVRFDREAIGGIVKLGVPVALQELLVGVSFMVIQAIVNAMGLVASAGIGVAEKVCAFIMLTASAFMQSMSAFVAQNIGAQHPDRAKKALRYGIAVSLGAGIIMGLISFFGGGVLSSIFSDDAEVVAAAHSYLKAYSIDCILTAFLFCFIGYYNGCGKTLFVSLQGIFAAFFIRIPFAWLMSRTPGVTLFRIGLATPAASIVQIFLCVLMYVSMEKQRKRGEL